MANLMKISRKKLRRLILESIDKKIDFKILHEGLFTGGSQERFYVIVEYYPKDILIDRLGIGAESAPEIERTIFYASTGTGGGANAGSFLPSAGMNIGLVASDWVDPKDFTDRWIIKMRGRKQVDPNTIAASIKTQLESMYPINKIQSKIKNLVAKDYELLSGRKPGDKNYRPTIRKINRYNMNEMMYQNKFKALRGVLEEHYPPYYWGDVNISSFESFNKSISELNQIMTSAFDALGV